MKTILKKKISVVEDEIKLPPLFRRMQATSILSIICMLVTTYSLTLQIGSLMFAAFGLFIRNDKIFRSLSNSDLIIKLSFIASGILLVNFILSFAIQCKTINKISVFVIFILNGCR